MGVSHTPLRSDRLVAQARERGDRLRQRQEDLLRSAPGERVIELSRDVQQHAQSSREPARGGNARPMRWTRPWQFTKVPSFSRYAAVGSTQCASAAVRFSFVPEKTKRSQRARQRFELGFAERASPGRARRPTERRYVPAGHRRECCRRAVASGPASPSSGRATRVGSLVSLDQEVVAVAGRRRDGSRHAAHPIRAGRSPGSGTALRW